MNLLSFTGYTYKVKFKIFFSPLALRSHSSSAKIKLTEDIYDSLITIGMILNIRFITQ